MRDICEGNVNTDRLRQEIFSIENEIYFVNERIHLFEDTSEEKPGNSTGQHNSPTEVTNGLEEEELDMELEEKIEGVILHKRKLPIVHIPRPPSQGRRQLKLRAARYKLPKL